MLGTLVVTERAGFEIHTHFTFTPFYAVFGVRKLIHDFKIRIIYPWISLPIETFLGERRVFWGFAFTPVPTPQVFTQTWHGECR